MLPATGRAKRDEADAARDGSRRSTLKELDRQEPFVAANGTYDEVRWSFAPAPCDRADASPSSGLGEILREEPCRVARDGAEVRGAVQRYDAPDVQMPAWGR